MRLAYQRQIGVDIIALGLGEAGGTNGDEFRLGARPYVQNGLLDIVVAAHDGGRFVHRRRLQRDRFAKVTHQQHHAE